MRTIPISEHLPPGADDVDNTLEAYADDPNGNEEELTPEQLAAFAELIKALRREGHSDSDSVRAAILSQMQQAQTEEQHAAAQHESRAQQQAVAEQLQSAFAEEVGKLQQTLIARVQRGEISQEQASALFESLVPDIQERYATAAENLQGRALDSRIGTELQSVIERYPSLAANEYGGARLVAELAKLSRGQYPVEALAELFDTSVAHAAQSQASQWLDGARESAVAEYLAKQSQNASFAPPVVPAGGGASSHEQSRPSFSDWTHDLFRRAGLK